MENIVVTKWRLARARFIGQRAFLSLSKAVTNKYVPAKESHNISIGIAQTSSDFSNTHPTILSKLLKEKNIDQLEQLGGIEGLAKSIHSDVRHGIDGDVQDVLRRKEVFGCNTYQKPPLKSFFRFVYEAFRDPTTLILLVCAALSLGFGIEELGVKDGWYGGGSIFVALFLAVLVSAIWNFRQRKQFDKLSKVSNNIQVEVVRKGRQQQISICEIVVGDVVCLKIGDQVAADGLFLEGHSLLVDESSMIKADPVIVDHIHNPFLYSGTEVADGYAKMLVTSVGMNTTWGEMMSTIPGNSDEQTPQYKMKKLTSAISKIGLAAGFLVVFVRYLIRMAGDENENKEFDGSKTKSDDGINSVLRRIITDAVTTAFAAIPEGLSLVVTLTLAYSMKRMTKGYATVKKLSACETMGSATVICTDKTGTLTLNQMNVTRFWLGYDLVVQNSTIAAQVLELIHHGVSLNTTGSVQRETELLGSSFKFSGSPTEKAILQWAVLELNMDMEMVNRNCTVLNVEAFNSQKKKSGVLMKRNVDNTIHAHWKGAAEIILATCSQYYDSDGNKKAIDDQERGRFGLLIEGMAARSLRCIAFACREVNADPNNQVTVKGVPDSSLTLLGIVGLEDPCCPEVKKAVEDCQHAGVNIKMITGDNVFTAKAIATECGILHPDQELPDGVVMEGVEFRTYTEEERMERVDKILVLARSSPFDKLLMVQCLRKKGHVVAVTGDGTNDALALKEADIGLSMGIQGIEVAKESSDIVLDGNFFSVVTVLKSGRCVYNNIQKFIQFHLAVSVAALVINFVTAVSAVEVPLTAVQLFWVNLVMGTLGAIALATEKPAKELMDNKPVGRTEPLVTNIMWRNILVQAFYQVIILLTVQFKGKSIFGVSEEVNETLFFNTFVLCQVFNEFNARELEKKNVFRGIHKNKLFVGIIGLTVILQVIMVEFMKYVCTQRLNWGQWGICLGLAAGSWPIGFLAKCIPVPKKPISSYFTWETDTCSFGIEDEESEYLRQACTELKAA